jgi:type IV secretory pathway VirB2 component (pilin)
MLTPKINGFYTSPGTFVTDAKRSIQSRFRLYKHQEPLGQISNRTVLSSALAQHPINQAIFSAEPYAAARLGTVEGDIISWRIRHPRRLMPIALLKNGKNLAGIFPATQEAAAEFADLYIDSVRKLDLLGVRNKDFFSGYFKMERTVIDATNPKALSCIDALSPYGEENSWVKNLSGKKVLVIHPFSSPIERQYPTKRSGLFPDKDWLPEFELLVYKPFQTAGDARPIGEPSTWAKALDQMLQEISQLSFDVALISACAYGLPLATGVKDMGKVGIHIGGVLQLFFGIRGGRWDPLSNQYDFLANYHSDAWVRPSKEETPKWSRAVEGGAYW